MEPVLLEFISRDNTKEGMQSVIGNMRCGREEHSGQYSDDPSVGKGA